MLKAAISWVASPAMVVVLKAATCAGVNEEIKLMNASCLGVIYCAASVVAVALGENLVAHVSLATHPVKTLRIFFDGVLPFLTFWL
ncbi:hypothetical protein D3C76_1280730 [compost metagenome]